MEKKFQLRLLSTGIVAYSDNLKALKELANSADMDFPSGRINYDISDTTTGEVVALQKAGLDCTLQDIIKEEYPTVRLYNAMLRHIMDCRNLTLAEAEKNVTMRDIRDMVIAGKFVAVRNMGTKTREEFYQMLIDFCGNTALTRRAININLDLERHAQVRNHPEELSTYQDPLWYWETDLEDDYFKKNPW